ncbi:hypothetical protein PG987_008134 [Apiospora arundinis]
MKFAFMLIIATSKGTGDGDGHDPRQHEQTDSLPVDGLDGAVAETDTDGGTGDAHRRRHRQRVLREDENGDGGTHFHGAASAGGVEVWDVELTLHDVVTIGAETDRDPESEHSKLPDGDAGSLVGSLAGGPGVVDDSPGADRVTDIVGTVSERGSAGSEDLDEGVGVLDLVGVLLGGVVDTLHTDAIGSAGNTGLGGVDVVVETVEESGGNLGREALAGSHEVLLLVDLAGSHGVVAESAHRPANGATVGQKLSAELSIAFGLDLLVGLGGLALGNNHSLLLLGVLLAVLLDRVGGVQGLVIVLDDGVLGNHSAVGLGNNRALQQERAHADVVPSHAGVALQDAGVQPGTKKTRAMMQTPAPVPTTTEAMYEGDFLPRPRLGGALIDNGQGADGSGDEEEERRGPDGPGGGVLAHVDNQLDHHEDGGTESSGDGRRHAQTGEDSTETLAVVPAPLDLGGTDSSNTNTGDSGDKGVGGRDVGRVTGAPHHPCGGGNQGDGEGHHLNSGVIPEGIRGNDAVLDRLGGSGAHGDGSQDLEDGTEDHGHSVRDGSGRNTGGPRVGNIV